MKKLNLNFKNVGEILIRDQLKQITGENCFSVPVPVRRGRFSKSRFTILVSQLTIAKVKLHIDAVRVTVFTNLPHIMCSNYTDKSEKS